MYHHFTTAHVMRLRDNPRACIIQEISSADFVSSLAAELLQWKHCVFGLKETFHQPT